LFPLAFVAVAIAVNLGAEAVPNDLPSVYGAVLLLQRHLVKFTDEFSGDMCRLLTTRSEWQARAIKLRVPILLAWQERMLLLLVEVKNSLSPSHGEPLIMLLL